MLIFYQLRFEPGSDLKLKSKEELMMDDQTTVAQLKVWADQFVEARNWENYHTPKNLAMSVAIEAAELMEIFQWKTPEESLQITSDPSVREHLGEEISDVLAYLLNLASTLDIDLSTVFQDKMEKNARKYPVGEETFF